MSLAIPMPERPRRARGRLQLLAIIGLVVGPMLLASAMYCSVVGYLARIRKSFDAGEKGARSGADASIPPKISTA